MNLDDTIVAIATPPGRGGIGVIRIAGPDARSIAAPMLRLRYPLEAGKAIFGELVEPPSARSHAEPPPGNGGRIEPTAQAVGTEREDNQARKRRKKNSDGTTAVRIDEVVVTYFQKPHSYTTDDIIEISAHGSPVVLRHVIELCLARGARLAEPGEFTMRAFLNGRIDLTQAEAVRDLIDSQTLFQAKVAAQQLEGALSNRLKPIKHKLVELIALLEAGIDFAEDDVSIAADATILDHIASVRAPLEQLAASFQYGKIVHEGLTLAIVGRPNVGKSSLFNCLVERERAIVTAQPGTTRDLVSETVAIGGIPVHLVDTAGIRRALDEAESIGIRKSIEALADADLVLVVLDVSQPVTSEDEELLRQVDGRPAIVVENKCDLVRSQEIEIPREERSGFRRAAQTPRQRLKFSVPSSQFMVPGSELSPIRTSSVTGAGIAVLRRAILEHAGGESGAQAETGFLTNIRHQKLVTDSLAALEAARNAVAARVPHEMLLLDLYSGLRPLDEITGATTTDDILNLIFGTFCIGK